MVRQWQRLVFPTIVCEIIVRLVAVFVVVVIQRRNERATGIPLDGLSVECYEHPVAPEFPPMATPLNAALSDGVAVRLGNDYGSKLGNVSQVAGAEWERDALRRWGLTVHGRYLGKRAALHCIPTIQPATPLQPQNTKELRITA
jgi:hypothetical protein